MAVIHSELLDALVPSSIRSITAKIRDKAQENIQVISFAGGLPSREFFPVEDLKKIDIRVFDEEGGDAIQYAASDGYDPLRRYLGRVNTKARSRQQKQKAGIPGK